MMQLMSLMRAFHARSLQEKKDLRVIIIVLVVSPFVLIACNFHIFRAQHDPALVFPQFVGRPEALRSLQSEAVPLRRYGASNSTQTSSGSSTKTTDGHRTYRVRSRKPVSTDENSEKPTFSKVNGHENENLANSTSETTRDEQLNAGNLDQCEGKYVYIYNLPSYFNRDLIDKCGRGTGVWVDLCGNLNNDGYGPSIPSNPVLMSHVNPLTMIEFEPPHAWFRTEQFSLEVIVHERLSKGYPCLTQDPDLANAFFIPYYAALDTAFTLFHPHLPQRDRLSQRLIGWLSGSDVWMKYQGVRQHFMVLGRVAWDLARDEGAVEGWGSALLSQSELFNVTMLLIERRPWVSNEIAIPYPTSFHPSSLSDVAVWQGSLRAKMRKRSSLLSTFIGTTSRGTEWSKALRVELATQCNAVDNTTCQEHKCGNGYANTLDCARYPEHVNALFQTSIFCLQPSGDSPTRKGIFDSLLAGCIPVLFTESSAYKQYLWHLPQDGSLYSVLLNGDDVIHGKIDVFAALAEIARDKQRLRRMQNEVINLVPRIVYSFPQRNVGSAAVFEDAFDLALKNLLQGSTIPTM